MRSNNVVFLGVVFLATVFSQTGNISTDVATKNTQILDAVNKGDFATALRISIALQAELRDGLAKSMPSPQQRLVSMEAMLSSPRFSDPTTATRRLLLLPQLAYDAGAYDKAKMYADQLVVAASASGVTTGVAGDATFEAHTVYGLLSLRSSDTVGASQALVKSSAAATNNSRIAQLGCRLDLASAVLALGERAAVTQFLDQCSAARSSDKSTFDVWVAAIKGGATPSLTRHYRATTVSNDYCEWMFPGERLTPLSTDNWRKRVVQPAAERAGVKLDLRTFRRT